MYMYLYMNMYLYLYLNMNMYMYLYMYMIMYLYMNALARRSPLDTQKTILKKSIGLFKKKRLTFSTTCNIVINVSDRTFILCVVE